MKLSISLAQGFVSNVGQHNHHIRNTCPECHGVYTCRCNSPKVETHNVCSSCKQQSTSALLTEKEVRARAAKANTTVELKITGGRECVDRLLSLLGMLQYNGNVGHSGIFAIPWDGDGADRIKIEGPLPDYKDAWSAASNYGGYAEMVGSNGRAWVISGKDIKQKLVWPKEEIE